MAIDAGHCELDLVAPAQTTRLTEKLNVGSHHRALKQRRHPPITAVDVDPGPSDWITTNCGSV